MKRDLAIRALKMAIALRSPSRGCIFHSDRGSQYCSHDYQKVLRDHGMKASMSGKGSGQAGRLQTSGPVQSGRPCLAAGPSLSFDLWSIVRAENQPIQSIPQG
jgi:hypothetical protein